jgi:hypothetical protein
MKYSITITCNRWSHFTLKRESVNFFALVIGGRLLSKPFRPPSSPDLTQLGLFMGKVERESS